MLCLKLFFVMGINWIADVLSWAMKTEDNEHFFYLTDIGNALQGVLIFIIFVCKKRILRLLNQKLCSQTKIWKTSNNSSSRNTMNTISNTNIRNREMSTLLSTTNNVNNHSTGDTLNNVNF